MEANQHGAPVGEGGEVRQVDPTCAGLEHGDILARGDDADLSRLHLVEEEGHGGEAHIHLLGQHLREGRGDAAGGGGLCVQLVLRHERQQRGVAGGAGQGEGDGLAVDIGDGLHRRIGGHIPILIGGAEDLAGDDLEGRALGDGPDRRADASPSGHVHAARDQGLDGLWSRLRVEDLDVQPMFAENARALPHFGDGGVPGAALGDGDLEFFGGLGLGWQRQRKKDDHAQKGLDERHFRLPMPGFADPDFGKR